MKALARLVGAVPGHDHPIELQNLPLEAEQLIAKRGKARTANLRHPFVARIGNNMQQFGDSLRLHMISVIERLTNLCCSLFSVDLYQPRSRIRRLMTALGHSRRSGQSPMTSDLLPTTDFGCMRDRVRLVPIVLQKSFCSRGRKFFELWARRSNNNVGDFIRDAGVPVFCAIRSYVF